MIEIRNIPTMRAGIFSKGPGYSIPKDTQQSMLANVERKAKAIPGPD